MNNLKTIFFPVNIHRKENCKAMEMPLKIFIRWGRAPSIVCHLPVVSNALPFSQDLEPVASRWLPESPASSEGRPLGSVWREPRAALVSALGPSLNSPVQRSSGGERSSSPSCPDTRVCPAAISRNLPDCAPSVVPDSADHFVLYPVGWKARKETLHRHLGFLA